MAFSKLEGEEYFEFDAVFLNDQIHRIFEHIVPLFSYTIKKYMFFHLLFFFLIITELTLLFFFLGFLVKSSLFAISLAFLFLTLFSYCTLRLYLQTKKKEQIEKIKETFIHLFKELIHFHEEIPEHHLALANACTKFSTALEGKETGFYHPPKWLDFLKPSMEKYSHWWHWLDIHHIREKMLVTAVNEQITLVKCEPTNLEVHAALANAYVMLSCLYVNPDQVEGAADDHRALSENMQKMMKKKFRFLAERAIEEFKILNDYAPDDPWVHAQLAYSYHDLGMPREEMREYEIMHDLCPADKEILFKLGILYFQQGENAKGLQIYDELKRSNYKRAEQLIDHYGDYTF
ncbi:MAG: hypothetical protein WB791_09690 [Waddliaceae bacterium]